MFWVVVQKLFKGKGINFCREHKAGRWSGQMVSSVGLPSPRDYLINFTVPTDTNLSKECAKYRLDAINPGILEFALDSFDVVTVHDKHKNRSYNWRISLESHICQIYLGQNMLQNLKISRLHVHNAWLSKKWEIVLTPQPLFKLLCIIPNFINLFSHFNNLHIGLITMNICFILVTYLHYIAEIVLYFSKLITSCTRIHHSHFTWIFSAAGNHESFTSALVQITIHTC